MMMVNLSVNAKKWLAFAAVSLVTTMINLDITVANMAVAAIAKTFHAPLSQMQWVINAYMLTHVVFLIIAGRLADIFGRKSIYLIGIGLFLLASIIIIVAPNIEILIGGRAIQGIGFAFSLTLGILLVTSIFPEEQRGFALGSYMTVAGLAQALGPSIGGLILQFLNWRWIFAINIPLSLLALVFVSLLYPKNNPMSYGERIDFTGMMWLVLSLTLLAFGLNQIDQWKIFSLLCAMGGFMVLLLFYKHLKRTQHPLINFSLFKNKVYCATSIIRALHMYDRFTVLFILPLYLLNILGESPFVTGAIIFCMTITFALVSPLAGMWLDRVGFVMPTKVSLILSLMAFLIMTQLGTTLSLPLLLSALVLLGIAAPIIGSSTPALNLSVLPVKDKGVGMGAFYMLAFLGSLIGIALSGSLLAFLSEKYFYSVMVAQNFALNLFDVKELLLAVNGASGVKLLERTMPLPDYNILAPIIKSSFVYGLRIVMWINAGLVVIALYLCRWLDSKNISH